MRDNRFLFLLYIIIYIVIVVSCASVDVNDSNSRNRNGDPWSKIRLTLRSVRSTFDTDKEVNKNLGVTFGINMETWLYAHDPIINSSCTFSNFFGRLCYVYSCEEGKTLYCEMDLRAGPCPESLEAYENSFHCWDVIKSRAKGRAHVCKLGGMIRSLGKRSKLKNGNNTCVYRNVMTFSGSIIEELISRADVRPSLVRKRRYFRRAREDTTKLEDDDNLKTDKNEEDGKTDGTTKNSKEDNDNDRSDKSKTEDGNDTSNSRSTAAASSADPEKPTGTTTEDDVTEKTSDDAVKSTAADVTDKNVTTSTEEAERMTTLAVTGSVGSEETTSSDEGKMTTTPAVTGSVGSEETASSDEREMTTTPAVTEDMVTTSSKDDTVTAPRERIRGDSRVDDSSFKDVTEINSLLSESFRKDSDLFTFQIERQIEKRIKEGEIGELLIQMMKTMTESQGLTREAAMDELKNEIRDHLFGSNIMTMARRMLDDLGQDLKIGKDGELSR